MEIVTGRTGVAHITSVQDRALNQGIVGKGVYILNTGQNLSAKIASNNEIHINDGALMYQGCEFAVAPSTYDTITVPNGSQGMQRKDLITIKYTYDGTAQTEKGEWGYIQGTPKSNNPTVPTIKNNNGDLQKLDSVAEAAVYVVTLNGVNIISVEPVVETISPLATLLSSAKLLWQGNDMMGESARVNLSEPISKQRLGIYLIFGLNNSDDPSTYGDCVGKLILKEAVKLFSSFIIEDGTIVFNTNCRKRIFISSDTLITGDNYNTKSGTGGGIQYDNTRMKLVAVWGI